MVVQYRERHNTRWTEETDGQLRQLVANGALLPAIAKTLGRTQEACRTRANILKLPVRTTDRPRRVGVHGEA